jgi:hypothetical protein
MKWEYTYVQVSEGIADNLTAMAVELNRLGSQGWEAISTVQKDSRPAHYVLLKRAIK